MSIRSDRCEYCGACLRSNRIAIWERVSEVVCGSLLLAVLTLSGYVAYQLIERQEQRFLDSPVWHEPLDSWRL
jgi:hypothetical protein